MSAITVINQQSRQPGYPNCLSTCPLEETVTVVTAENEPCALGLKPIISNDH